MFLELLEDRRVLAAVSWTGNGGNLLWSNPANWSTNQIPGEQDDVTLSAPGNVTIVYDSGAAATINSLTANDSLQLTSGSILVSGTLAIEAGQTLTATGVGVSFVAQGIPTVSGANLLVSSDATLSLPALTSFVAAQSVTWRASNGGILDLSNITDIDLGPNHVVQLHIEARSGGRVDLQNVVQISDAATNQARLAAVSAEGANSRIDLSSLTHFEQNSTGGGWVSSLSATNFGTINVGANTTVAKVNVTLNTAGRILTSSLSGVGTFTVASGATLSGIGTLSGNVVNQAEISPGNSPGIITINGDYSQSAGAVLDMELAGTNAATPEFDQLIVNGTVSLAGTLNVELISGFQPDLGDSFRIIDNDGTDAIVGTFDGLAEGATFTVGSSLMTITYMGGTGNDVVLSYVSTVYSVTTTSNSGAGSLRQAIEDANANPGPDQIDFDIPTSDPNYNAGSSSWTITLTSVLPSITDPVVIDGTTAAGYAGTPVVEVNFGNVGPGQIGLHVTSGSSTIRGLALNRSGGVGVWIASHNNFIEHNYIGTDVTGTIDRGNVFQGIYLNGNNNTIQDNLISGNDANGIWINGGGNNGRSNFVIDNRIGTNTAGTGPLGNGINGMVVSDGARDNFVVGNTISSNGNNGVWLLGSGVANNRIQGNRIGTDIGGVWGLGNTAFGVRISDGANGNWIGTDGDGTADAVEGNLISANGQSGIEIYGVGTTDNVVAGNFIGTNAEGTSSIANTLRGVGVFGAATNTRIGTDGNGVGDVEERNVISGNLLSGIAVAGLGTDSTLIAGNFIGTNAAGTSAIANVRQGVSVSGAATNTRIGTDGNGVGDFAERNVISGNLLSGIAVGGLGTDSTLIAGNFIGTNAAGTSAIANAGSGVNVSNGAKNTRIGTDGNDVGDVAERNVISGNLLSGISVSGTGTDNTVIAANFIGTNAAGTRAIANAQRGVSVFGAAKNTRIGTDGNGVGDVAERNVISGNMDDGISVSGTGTDNTVIAGNYIGSNAAGSGRIANGRAGVEVVVPATNTRVGTNGDGNGFDANERNVISGNNYINVFVSGSTPGTVIAGNFIGTNAAGTASLGNGWVGVYLWAGASNVRVGTDGNGIADDLERNVISGNNGDGVAVSTFYYSIVPSNNVIAGNYIGLNALGTAAVGNAAHGISVFIASSNTRIGTDGSNDAFNANERNVISGNSGSGINISNSASSGAVVAGNWVGLNVAGSAAIPNAGGGVRINRAVGARIGTNTDGIADELERNVVSGNSGSGITIQGGVQEILSLVHVDQMIAGTLPSRTATGTITSADFSDVLGPALGNWNFNNSIPGGGGDDFAVVVTGSLQVNTADTFSFAIAGDDGGRLRINGTTVINDDSLHGFSARYGQISLAAGLHTFEWVGFEREGAAGWELSVAVGGGNTSQISTANGWKVIGDPIPHSQVELSGTMNVTSYYSTQQVNTSTVVVGNFVGTNPTGTQAIPNSSSGIVISNSTMNSTIGGTTPAARNIISGNAQSGVLITGAGTTGSSVVGNYIGTDVTGQLPLGGQIGVSIQSGASNSVIGGFTSTPGTGAGNVIAGTTSRGISIISSAGNGTLIRGNIIGLSADGLSDITLTGDGIRVQAGLNAVIGGDDAADGLADGIVQARNIISGFAAPNAAGIAFSASGSNLNTSILGNYIGTDITGTIARPNYTGVAVGNAPGTRIGGTTDGAGNVISGNDEFGVHIFVAGNVNVQGNRIGTSADGTGAVPNDTGIFISSTANNTIGGTTVGSRNVISGNSSAGVLISAAGATGNTVLGNYIGTDLSGRFDVGNGSVGLSIDGASSNTIGTTEYGQSTLSSDGLLSFPQGLSIAVDGAVYVANAFQTALPGLLGGIYRIDPVTGAQLATSTSGLLDSATDVLIDLSGDLIALDLFNGIVRVNATTGAQTSISDFQNAGLGPVVDFAYTVAREADGSFIVPDIDNNRILRVDSTTGIRTIVSSGGLLNGPSGVAIEADGSILTGSSNSAELIRVNPVTGTQQLVAAGVGSTSHIKVAPDGAIYVADFGPGVGNDGRVLRIDRVSGTVKVVAEAALLRNVYGLGLEVGGSLIVAETGDNTTDSRNIIRLIPAAAGNKIAFNATGVMVKGNATGNRIQLNSIYSNNGLGIDDGLGIDLGGDGVTPNDTNDLDTGPNGLQNYPILSPAVSGGQTRVIGQLQSTPSANFDIDFYASSVADPSGFGEGQRFLGSISVTTNVSGLAVFDTLVPGTTVNGEFISAIATDSSGNSSEFSNTVSATTTLPPTITANDIILTEVLGDDGFGQPTTVFTEGQRVRLDGLFDNAETNAGHDVTIDWGDGSPVTTIFVPSSAPGFPPTRGFAAEHVYADDLPAFLASDIYPITIVVADRDDNASGAVTKFVTVQNVAPQFDGSLVATPSSGFEGGSTVLSGSFVDAGDDIHWLDINWGDGSGIQTVILPRGSRTFSVPHVFLDNATQVTVTVRDDDGGIVEQSLSVSFENVPPEVSMAGPLGGLEGSPLVVQALGSDAGVLDTITYSWRVFLDGRQIVSAAGNFLNFIPSDDGIYDIHLQGRDDDGAATTATHMVTVSNVAPVIQPSSLELREATGGVVSAVNEGEQFTLRGVVSDPGINDSQQVTITWGDGSPNTVISLAAGSNEFFATHTYADDAGPGTSTAFPVSIHVTDFDGGQSTLATSINVQNVAPQVSILDNGSDETTVRLRARVVDPSLSDTHSFAWSFPGGTVPVGIPLDQATIAFPRPVSGIASVQVVATDSDSASDTASAVIAVGTDQDDTITVQPGLAENSVLVSITTSLVTVSQEVPSADVVLIQGLAGNDTITILPSVLIDAIIDGGADNDTIQSASGNDTLIGGPGDDLLQAGEGNNVIDISEGNDTAIAGSGDDRYLIFGFSTKTIIDEGGNDTLDFSGVSEPSEDTIDGVSVNLTQDSGEPQTVRTDGEVSLDGQFENVIGTPYKDYLVGNDSSNLLFGGGGDDTIDGGVGDDSLFGGDGNDLIFGGLSGDDTIDGGSGDDSIVGGDGNDLIFGGFGDDTIVAGDGDNSIIGGDGNDLIFGGLGNDTIDGGSGDDSILGGDGNDLIFGGFGDDTIVAGDGDNSIIGGDGNDLIFGGLGDDTIDGGAGDDSIGGGDGNDLIFGGVGDDTIDGGAGQDSLSAGDGNDLIFGGVGDDTIDGGLGDDSIGGGDGNDLIFGGLGDDTIDAGGGNDSISGGDGNDVIFGGLADGNDTIDGGAGDDSIIGGDGNDLIFGGEGDDTIRAGSGDESIEGGDGNDLIFGGGDGSDTIDGGRGDDSIIGGDGNDFIFGGEGDDTIRAGSGDESIEGGDGNDLIFGGGDGSDTIDGGRGDDSIIGGDGNDFIFGGEGNDTIYAGSGDESIESGYGNDLIFGGGDGSDTIHGGSGNDSIIGGDGNDFIFGGDGDDTIYAGSGDESIVGGDGNDVIFGGGDGSDTIDGGAGDDSIIGGDGNDYIFGGDGDDTIYAGSGHESIVGGDGNDVIFGGGDGSDTIDGGAGDDSIIGGEGNDFIFGGAGDDTIIGGSGDESIIGGEGNDIIFGGDGNDTIQGSDGDDSIVGGEGNDIIFGGDGDDTIGSSSGNDSLSGGAGNDLIFTLVNGDATITNTTIVSGTRTVTILDGEALQVIGDEGDNRLDASARTLPVNLVGGDGNDTLIGGSGETVIDSGNGIDVIAGGSGKDVYRFFAGDIGVKQIVDTGGEDTLDFRAMDKGVTVNLSIVDIAQPVTSGLSLILSGDIENAFGSDYNDTLIGNSLNNKLYGFGGADYLDGGDGDDILQAGRRRYVYLDFDSATESNEYQYSQSERDAIQARIEEDYAAFDVEFSQTVPLEEEFVSIIFNAAVFVSGSNFVLGGVSNRVGWRELVIEDFVQVDVNGFFGTTANKLSPTSENYVALSSTIASHELAHTYGLRHLDAFGPPGSGVFVGVSNNANRFRPSYTGPAAANETRFHLSASPASVGTSLVDALGNPYFGQREALKLAFAESGSTVAESSSKTEVTLGAQTPMVHELGDLPGLVVPNTVVQGAAAGQLLSAAAINVIGHIDLAGATSESDFYSFAGSAGDVVTIEVISESLRHRVNNIIDSVIRVYDGSGDKIAYYANSSGAFNDDQMEPTDSVLLDLVLPHSGTFYVEVDTFSFSIPEIPNYLGQFNVVAFCTANPTHIACADTDTGPYELLIYRFDGTVAQPPAADTLIGGAGADTLYGNSGKEVVIGFNPDEGDVLFDSSGDPSFEATDNHPPTVTIQTPVDGVFGVDSLFTFTATDADAIDQSGQFDYIIDWGDGTRSIETGPSVMTITHNYSAVSPTGTFRITAHARDARGAVGPNSTTSFVVLGWSVMVDPIRLGQPILVVVGSQGDDGIRIGDKQGDYLRVNIRDRDDWVRYKGTVLGNVDRILVFGHAGDDQITIDNDIDIDAQIWGGTGNDKIKGGRGNDVIFGEAGDDEIRGGDGHDILIGGSGKDRIRGEIHDDILIGGFTAFDQEFNLLAPSSIFPASARLSLNDQRLAIEAIMAEWTSNRPVSLRRANLTGSGIGTGKNGTHYLKFEDSVVASNTVFDDGEEDTIWGNQGTDWFLANLDGPLSTRDTVQDRTGLEVVSDTDRWW